MKSYAWTGPDDSFADQNPYINNVTLMKAGTYTQRLQTLVVGYYRYGRCDNSFFAGTTAGKHSICKGSTLQLKGGPDGMVTYMEGQNGAVINTNTNLPDTSIQIID